MCPDPRQGRWKARPSIATARGWARVVNAMSGDGCACVALRSQRSGMGLGRGVPGPAGGAGLSRLGAEMTPGFTCAAPDPMDGVGALASRPLRLARARLPRLAVPEAGARELDRDKARCSMHVSSSPPFRTGLAALTAPGSAPVIILHGCHEALVPISPVPRVSTRVQLARALGTFVSLFSQARGLRHPSSSWCARLSRAPTTMPHPTLP